MVVFYMAECGVVQTPIASKYDQTRGDSVRGRKVAPVVYEHTLGGWFRRVITDCIIIPQHGFH